MNEDNKLNNYKVSNKDIETSQQGNFPTGFKETITKVTGEHLCSFGIDTCQVNLGYLCNQECSHCHINASPKREEVMTWETMEKIIQAIRKSGNVLVDITGGAPELNPDFRNFVEVLHHSGHTIQVRTNLTVLLEPGLETLPEFFRDHEVKLVASMPCYLEKNVQAQRGPGVYEKSVKAMLKLNEVGYGTDPRYQLNLVYNPGGPFLPPSQSDLEKDYKRELFERFGIKFNRLLTITNLPIGRFKSYLQQNNQYEEYMKLLKKTFNPSTLDGLMCRRQVSIGWDGTLYDCDFNLALGMPINHGSPNHIRDFDPELLSNRKIVIGDHCFGCTAGSGSSCGGSIIDQQ